MSREKISFSLNADEGLASLQQAAASAGTQSNSLHAKQIVISHLSGSGNDSELALQIEDLYREVIALRRQAQALHQSLSKSLEDLGSRLSDNQQRGTATGSITRDDLRNALFLVLMRQRPASKAEAIAIADAAVPRSPAS